MGNNNRNKPCPCGSGKKFKKCHLNREDQPRLTHGDLEDYSKTLRSKKLCSVKNLFPDECSNNIVKAHTISKSGSLNEISESGHVMGLRASIYGLIKNNLNLNIEKVGVNIASTFSGFCSIHDKKIFSPLEDEIITLNDKQLFLLAYRSFCRELFHKQNQEKTAQIIKEADRGQKEIEQILIQNYASEYKNNVDLALRDLGYTKRYLDSILINKRYSEIRHCIFELSEKPMILVSAVAAPEMDFHGNALQVLGNGNNECEYIFYNCISYDGKGCFVFSWLSEHDRYCSKFIKSLLKFDNEEVSDALVRFCYSFSDNTWASPYWWNSLSAEAKKSINDRIIQGTTRTPYKKTSLVDDGVKFNAMKISNREVRFIKGPQLL